MTVMTVGELIHALQQMPPDTPVCGYAADECVTSLGPDSVELRNLDGERIGWYDDDAKEWRHDAHVLVMP